VESRDRRGPGRAPDWATRFVQEWIPEKKVPRRTVVTKCHQQTEKGVVRWDGEKNEVCQRQSGKRMRWIEEKKEEESKQTDFPVWLKDCQMREVKMTDRSPMRPTTSENKDTQNLQDFSKQKGRKRSFFHQV
jgi:hypothetical protein